VKVWGEFVPERLRRQVAVSTGSDHGACLVALPPVAKLFSETVAICLPDLGFSAKIWFRGRIPRTVCFDMRPRRISAVSIFFLSLGGLRPCLLRLLQPIRVIPSEMRRQRCPAVRFPPPNTAICWLGLARRLRRPRRRRRCLRLPRSLRLPAHFHRLRRPGLPWYRLGPSRQPPRNW